MHPPSEDDQTVVQTALLEEDATLCFAAGTFTFNSQLSLDVDGVTLTGVGSGVTIFDFGAQDPGANGMVINSDNVTVQDLDVKNTPGDGIRVNGSSNVAFQDMAVLWDDDASLENGAYGLYPAGCDGVMIQRTVVKGARDAGIYVGQSTNILVADSEAYGNVAGIEIESSTDAEVTHCHAHDNTAGILVFNLPNLPVTDGKRAKVHGNVIENNNVDNFAEPGIIVANVPPGIGVMLLATDDNEVHDNQISGNGSSGAVVVSYLAAIFLATLTTRTSIRFRRGITCTTIPFLTTAKPPIT